MRVKTDCQSYEVEKDIGGSFNFCSAIGSRISSCKNDCPDYEQDPQIARDNDTVAIADKCRIKEPDYKDLYHKACDIIMNQHEEMNKLKHDNNLMSSFIAGRGGIGESGGGKDGE